MRTLRSKSQDNLHKKKQLQKNRLFHQRTLLNIRFRENNYLKQAQKMDQVIQMFRKTSSLAKKFKQSQFQLKKIKQNKNLVEKIYKSLPKIQINKKIDQKQSKTLNNWSSQQIKVKFPPQFQKHQNIIKNNIEKYIALKLQQESSKKKKVVKRVNKVFAVEQKLKPNLSSTSNEIVEQQPNNIQQKALESTTIFQNNWPNEAVNIGNCKKPFQLDLVDSVTFQPIQSNVTFIQEQKQMVPTNQQENIGRQQQNISRQKQNILERQQKSKKENKNDKQEQLKNIAELKQQKQKAEQTQKQLTEHKQQKKVAERRQQKIVKQKKLVQLQDKIEEQQKKIPNQHNNKQFDPVKSKKNSLQQQNILQRKINFGINYLLKHKFKEAFNQFNQASLIHELNQLLQQESQVSLQKNVCILSLFLKVFKKIDNLKKTYKKEDEVGILQQKQNKIYEVIIQTVEKESQQPQKLTKFKKNLQKTQKQIYQQIQKLKQKIDNLEVQLQAHHNLLIVINTNYLTQIQQELTSKNKKDWSVQTQKKMQYIQLLLKPNEKLEQKFRQLKKYNTKQKDRLVKYGKTLYGLLNSHITSYRALQTQVVAKGNTQQGRVSGFLSKLSFVFGYLESAPLIGDAISYVNKICQTYIGQSDNLVIQQITSKFQDLHSSNLIEDAISQVILKILDSAIYCKKIENLKGERYLDCFELFAVQKKKIIRQLEGISDRPLLQEVQLASADCSYIISSLVKIKQDQIKKLKEQQNSENVMMIVVKQLLKERQEEQEFKQLNKYDLQKWKCHCCYCSYVLTKNRNQ